MSRHRATGLVVLLLLLLPAVGLGIAASRFDPNALLPALRDAVRDATGRELRLPDGLQLSWTPRPRLEAANVSLDNIAGGSRPDMARAERVAVELAIFPLLRRRLELTRLELTGPNILFETVGGRPNWRLDLPDAPPAPAPTPPPAAGTALPAAPPTPPGGWTLAVRRTDVRNGMVTWRLPARTKVLGIRAMDVRQGSDGGPIEWDGTYVYADNAPFRLSGSALPTAGVAAPWNTRLDVSAFDTEASATGTMDTAGFYDLQLEARSGTLDRLNALLPEMHLPAIRDLVLSARVGNGSRPGDVPVIGASSLRFASLAASARLPGLQLGPTEVTVDKPGGTATVRAAGRYAGQGFTLSGTAGVPLHPDQATALPLDLRTVSAPPGTARFELGLKGDLRLARLQYAGLDAALHLATPALAGLRGLVSPALPALTEFRFDGRVRLPASGNPVAFSVVRLRGREGDLSGDGTLDAAGDAPALRGRFRSERLDLDAALHAFGIDPAPAAERPRPAAGPVIPDDELAWSALEGKRLELDLAVASLLFLREEWRGVELGLSVADQQLRRGTLAVGTTAGPVRLALTADGRPADPPATLTIEAPELPLSLPARYAGLPGPVSGTARVSARLRAAGRSLREMAGTLEGTVTLAAVGGQVGNATLVALLGPALEALNIRVPASGNTALRCLGLRAAFRGGVGRVAPIALESTYLSLAGEGTVDLRREALDFDLKPLATVSGSPVAVPVKVQGPFRAITGRLDADLMDKLGLFLDGLFGGDDSTACVDAGLLPRRR